MHACMHFQSTYSLDSNMRLVCKQLSECEAKTREKQQDYRDERDNEYITTNINKYFHIYIYICMYVYTHIAGTKLVLSPVTSFWVSGFSV